jgi:hypothetical protein
MKKTVLLFAVLTAGALALVTGCANQSGTSQGQARPIEQPGATMVDQTPPELQKEPIPKPPGPKYAYAWIPGYWTWQGHWAWTSGTWVPLPHPHLVWVGGHWIKWGTRYKWIPGRWE